MPFKWWLAVSLSWWRIPCLWGRGTRQLWLEISMAPTFWHFLQNGPLCILLQRVHVMRGDFVHIAVFCHPKLPKRQNGQTSLSNDGYASIFFVDEYPVCESEVVKYSPTLVPSNLLLPIQSEKNCQIVEEIWTMIERAVNSKDFRRQPRSGWPFFHQLCEKYYRKRCKYMCNNSKKQKGKKISTSPYRSEFEHNGMDISYQKRLESLDLKKAVHALHASMCQKDL